MPSYQSVGEVWQVDDGVVACLVFLGSRLQFVVVRGSPPEDERGSSVEGGPLELPPAPLHLD
jgi:hypothetical protein